MVLKFHFIVQQRYVLTGVLFLILALAYAFRTSFPLILTQMVYVPNSNTTNINHTSIQPLETNSELICPIEYSMAHAEASQSNADHRELYDWSQELQGVILSSYSWGSVLTQIPGGILTQIYGGKKILLISTVLSSIFLAITPIAVIYGGAIGLIVTRTVIGFVQGPLIPSIATIMINWIPVEERSRCCATAYMGIHVGSFLSTYIVGIILSHNNRWDVIFYGLAVMGIISAIIIALLCYENPQDHPLISVKEREYLKLKTAEYLEVEKKNVPSTPWIAIFTSIPVLTLLVSLSLATVSSYILNIGLTKYLNDVLHVPIERNSIYSTVPHIATIFVSFFTGFLGDWMHGKCKVSLTNVRKTFAFLSTVPPAIFAILASYGDCNETFVVTMLSFGVSIQGFGAAALVLVPFDLGPNYSGPLNAVVHTFYAIAALLAPIIVGHFTPNSYLSEWRLVWWFTCVAWILSTAMFLVWGSAKIQPWNTVKKTDQNS